MVTAKKRLQMQTTQLQHSIVKLDEQARQALAAGREDLARQALERKSGVQQQLQGLDGQVAGLEQQQEKLVASEKQLSAKIEAFRSQKEVIKAQYSAAEAQVRIGEAATGIGEQMADTGLAIQRAKDKTEQMQARAGAMDELISAGTLDDFTRRGQTQLDRELAQLASQSQVESGAGAAEVRARPGRGAAIRQRLAERRDAESAEGQASDRPDHGRRGQFEISDELHGRLDELDEQAVAALDAKRRGQAAAPARRRWPSSSNVTAAGCRTTTSARRTSSSRRPTCRSRRPASCSPRKG